MDPPFGPSPARGGPSGPSRTRADEHTPPKLCSFKNCYIGTIICPCRTFDSLMADNRRLKFGLLALATNAVLYNLVYIFLAIGHGALSSFKPFLAAGVGQLLSRLFAGKGSFEDTLSVIDLRHYEVLLNTPTIWRAILLTFYGISVAWFMVLFPKGVGAAQRIKAGPAVLVGLSAYFVYQGVFMIFNQ